jgi:hypothetical protein
LCAKHFDIEILKLATAGERFNRQSKYIKDMPDIDLHGIPIYFTSNFPIEHPYHSDIEPYEYADFFEDRASTNFFVRPDFGSISRRCQEEVAKLKNMV